MASETATSSSVETDDPPGNWKATVAGGLVGALAFGVMMAIMTPPVLEMAIPAMYGIEGPAGAIGFTIHMAHGAIIALPFAALVGLADLDGESAQTQVAAGLGYGILVWVVLAVVVMPIWLQAVGFGMAPDVPNIAIESLIGHAVYGAVLGAIYYSLEDI